MYTAEPMTAVVVDATTRKPIEGANVIALWRLEGRGMSYSATAGFLKVMETVSGTDGRIAFPGWGPRVALQGNIRLDAPGLIIFKPGYRLGVFSNSGSAMSNAPWRLTSSWNNRELRLEPLTETQTKYLHENHFLSTELALLREDRQIGQIDRFVCAVVRAYHDESNGRDWSEEFSPQWLRNVGISCD
jgi:hypothetical protein